MNDGKVGHPAVKKPTVAEMKRYCTRLRDELDQFLGYESDHRHFVDIIQNGTEGMVCVDFQKATKSRAPTVSTDEESASALADTRNALTEELGQWLYFNRDLRIYDRTKTFIFKPMQRFHWTQSQAMIDASEIIAETVSAEEAVG